MIWVREVLSVSGEAHKQERKGLREMENLSYISLSQQTALKRQMDIVANNIANMSTPGFKSESVLFEEYVRNSAGSQKDPSGEFSQVLDAGSWRNLEQGPLSFTNNPLDVAITGDGYFAVETPAGTRYTRAGNFSLNDQGEIVTAQGHKVIGDGGDLTIPEGESQIQIDKDGNVSTESGEIGKFKIVGFENEQMLTSVGENMYQAPADSEIEPENISVSQGAIEGSNVNSVVEMTRMIDILRTYQQVQKFVQGDHDRQRSAIRTLSQVN